MVGEHAQCTVPFVVSWLGQRPPSSSVLQVGVSQHPASPRTSADSRHGSVIGDGGGGREPRERGCCGLGQIAVTIAAGKGGGQGLFCCRLPHSFGMKGGFGLVSA